MEFLKQQEAPWLNASIGLPDHALFNNEINGDVIKSYYFNVFENGQSI
ncbi:hypothetical protein [Bacillus cereus]|nr:hypothetical protein [Bacillus cereus]